MTHFSTLAVVAPSSHVEIAPTAPISVPTVSNYIGAAAILTMLAVMIATGLSAAGIKHKRVTVKSSPGHLAH